MAGLWGPASHQPFVTQRPAGPRSRAGLVRPRSGERCSCRRLRPRHPRPAARRGGKQPGRPSHCKALACFSSRHTATSSVTAPRPPVSLEGSGL